MPSATRIFAYVSPLYTLWSFKFSLSKCIAEKLQYIPRLTIKNWYKRFNEKLKRHDFTIQRPKQKSADCEIHKMKEEMKKIRISDSSVANGGRSSRGVINI